MTLDDANTFIMAARSYLGWFGDEEEEEAAEGDAEGDAAVDDEATV
jgi:hypothetical protein